MLKVSRVYVTRENFENIVQFGAFWCIFWSDCVLKNSHKINIFWIKNNYYVTQKFIWKTSYNWCVLVYTLLAFRMKIGYFHIENNNISCTHAPQRENWEKYLIWCVLVYILIRFLCKFLNMLYICSENTSYKDH